MKRAGWVIALVFVMVTAAAAQRSFRGTVIRMKMSECSRQHGFISAMSGTPVVTTQACPEYTVMTDRVVYVLVGRKPEEFIPLAENITFHVRKNEVVVISEDEKDASRFAVRQMTLREDWERDQQEREAMALMAERTVNYQPRNTPRAELIQASSQ